MAAPEAGSAPPGEGEGSPAPEKPSRWRRGVPVSVPLSQGGGGALNFSRAAGTRSPRGARCTTFYLGT